MSAGRRAVVLFNLGAPDRPEAVGPFLRNLFRDPAILPLPLPLRSWLARRIARRRLGPARANYALLGGGSPLLAWTERQARALEAALAEDGPTTRCFIAMRYWHPRSAATAATVRAWAADQVLLLPLYPQFSTTTTGSSIAEWREAAARAGIGRELRALCCWFADPAYIAAIAALVRRAQAAARERISSQTPLRVLFSAHGLPERVVAAGDPYQFQIEHTAAALAMALDLPRGDWVICYQSRATPERWLAPSTEAALAEAARDHVAVLLVPIAFVSDHSETLVELDIEYRALAERLGVPGFFRAPAPNDDPDFIAALAGLVRRAFAQDPGLCSFAGPRVCPPEQGSCPHRRHVGQIAPPREA